MGAAVGPGAAWGQAQQNKGLCRAPGMQLRRESARRYLAAQMRMKPHSRAGRQSLCGQLSPSHICTGHGCHHCPACGDTSTPGCPRPAPTLAVGPDAGKHAFLLPACHVCSPGALPSLLLRPTAQWAPLPRVPPRPGEHGCPNTSPTAGHEPRLAGLAGKVLCSLSTAGCHKAFPRGAAPSCGVGSPGTGWGGERVCGGPGGMLSQPGAGGDPRESPEPRGADTHRGPADTHHRAG